MEGQGYHVSPAAEDRSYPAVSRPTTSERLLCRLLPGLFSGSDVTGALTSASPNSHETTSQRP